MASDGDSGQRWWCGAISYKQPLVLKPLSSCCVLHRQVMADFNDDEHKLVVYWMAIHALRHFVYGGTPRGEEPPAAEVY